jgi:dephospho-CoA kinase
MIGLTGGIASGKSTASRRFAELGVPIVDADALAREVVAPGSDGLAEIVSVFGPDVLDVDGALDRKKLGAIVFDDAELRRKLEHITHPRIAALSLERMARLATSGAPYGLYEAALLVEKGTHHAMNGLVVVAASPEVQLARVMVGVGRLGDNLFSNCVLALDVLTGTRRWHFQDVRHDIWDLDVCAPPNLVTIVRDGKRVDAVTCMGKSGHLFVLDRESGQPVFPVRLRQIGRASCRERVS